MSGTTSSGGFGQLDPRLDQDPPPAGSAAARLKGRLEIVVQQAFDVGMAWAAALPEQTRAMVGNVPRPRRPAGSPFSAASGSDATKLVRGFHLLARNLRVRE
jgi:hypothetical protein